MLKDQLAVMSEILCYLSVSPSLSLFLFCGFCLILRHYLYSHTSFFILSFLFTLLYSFGTSFVFLHFSVSLPACSTVVCEPVGGGVQGVLGLIILRAGCVAAGSSSAETNWNKTLPCSQRKKERQRGIKTESCLQLQVIGGECYEEREMEKSISVCVCVWVRFAYAHAQS